MSTEDNRTWNPVGWFEIYVTDMDRAKAFYGDVVVGKQSIGEMGFIAIITDSEGNSIGLHSWR